MAGSAHTLKEYLNTLIAMRCDIYSGSPSALPELLTQTAQALQKELYASQSPPKETLAILFAVREIAAADTIGTLQAPCLRFFLSLQAYAWPHAIRHILANTLPFGMCEPALNSLLLHERLLLAHEFLRGNHSPNLPLSKWCKKQLSQSTEWDFTNILKLLSELYFAGREINLQLLEKIETHNITQKCITQLSVFQSSEININAAQALCMLGEQPSASLLEASLNMPQEVTTILLEALRTKPSATPEQHKALSKLLYHKSIRIRVQTLRSMIALSTPKIEKIFLLIFRSFPQERHRFYPPLLALSPEKFNEIIDSLTYGLRTEIQSYLLHILFQAAPDLASHSMINGKQFLQGVHQVPAATLKNFILTCKRKAYLPHRHTAGQLAMPLYGDKKTNIKADKLFANALKTLIVTPELDIRRQQLTGHTITDREIVHPMFSGSTFRSCHFLRCTFTKAEMDHCTFTGVTFTDCTFTNGTFTQSTFTDCTFTHTTLSYCNLAGSCFADTTFTECSLIRAEAEQICLRSSRLDRCSIDEASLWGALFTKTALLSCHFSLCDFAQCTFFCTTLRGITFAECTLSGISVERSQWEHVRSHAGTHLNCRMRQTLCDEPHLLIASLHNREKEVYEVSCKLCPADIPGWTFQLQGLAHHVITQVLHYRQTNTSRARFLRQNALRLALTSRTLGKSRMPFFTILPLLLQTRIFEEAHAPDKQWPCCCISGYHPTLETWQLAMTFFGTSANQLSPQNELTIDAVYTIGSVGTIAMTTDSDIDYWVTLAPSTYTPQLAAALQEKLATISRWAEDTLGLETTFFVMHREAVKINDFGISQGESSGTAQALLLKEEFYRTALKVCGRDLAWWSTPPGISREAYEVALQTISSLPFHCGTMLVDFGYLENIPAEEFYGAALWQIVKALHSPFKSVMKLGLLEAYLSGHDMMLCEIIKKNLLEGSRSLIDTDPYITLIRTLHEHYLHSADMNAANLLQTSFTAKIQGSGNTQKDDHLMVTLRKRAFMELYKSSLRMPKTQQTFLEAKELGTQLNNFFLHAYTSLQQRLEAKHITARITPEDITRLGRKIFSAFAPKKGKISRLPFINSMGRSIREIQFRKDTTPGVQKKWTAFGLPAGVPARRENFTEIKRDSDPVRLMAWMITNGLWSPEMPVDVDMSMSPIAVQDVTALLSGLQEFFPSSMLETNTEESLKEEKVLRAYCVQNFTLARDTSVQKEFSVVYCTNWGELFCHTYKISPKTKDHTTLRPYITTALPHPLPENTLLQALIPYKSRTPRLLAQ